MNEQVAKAASVPPAVRRYMQELELQLKQIPGLCPEDALADAREFLMGDYEALQRSGEPPEVDAHYDWIVSQFGDPSQVAEQYSSQALPTPNLREGCAPGWRICCTKCGRSAPYASTGAIRIGARSIHKYVLGGCTNCKSIRWCRVIQDMEKTNLTDQMCDINLTPEQLRRSMHWSVAKMIRNILLLILGIQALVWTLLIFVFKVFG
jgi:hypothetical protein